jgi:hypothetical protein
MALLDEIRKAQVLNLLGERLQGLLEVPTSAARFMVNPTAVLDAMSGKTAMPKEKGFAEGLAQIPQKENLTVLDPANRAYMEGYSQGEPFGYASMALPFAGAGATKLSDKLVQTITGNPMATGAKVIDYASAYNPSQIFIGQSSKSWKPEMAFKAAKMEKAGNTPQEIWEATGTVKGLDNYFRQEIPDNKAFLMGGNTFGETVLNRMKSLEVDKPTVKDILYHPDFLEAYPQLGNIEIQFTKKGNPAKAEWLPTENIIRVNADLPPDVARNSLLHELQHAVQKEEIWNTGADANAILQKHLNKQKDLQEELTKLNVEMKFYANKPEYADKYNEIMAQKQELARQWDYDPMSTAMKEYRAYGGEAEARLTQAREKMSKEERAKVFPFAKGENALDIDPESALIRLEHDQPTITRKELLEQQMNRGLLD